MKTEKKSAGASAARAGRSMQNGKNGTGRRRKTSKRDDTTRRWLLGFVFLFFSLYVAMSVFSYFLYWKTDQAVARLPLSETKGEEVFNWGGRFGTKIGEWLVSDSFGVFGFLIPVIFIVLSLRVLRFRPVMLNKAVRISLMAMILGSVTLGYAGGLFGKEPGAFGTGLGGKHGIYMAGWLESYLSYGTGLLLLLLIALLAIYINRNTIFFLNRVGRGIADKSKDLTVAVAGKASGLLSHPREDEAGEEQAAGESTEMTESRSEPAKPVDYDYRYEDDSVAPIAPMAKRKPEPRPEPEEEFGIRIEGEEEPEETRDDVPDEALAESGWDGAEERFMREGGTELVPDEPFVREEAEETVEAEFVVEDEAREEPEENPEEGERAEGDEANVPNADATAPEGGTVLMDENFEVDKGVDETTVPDELIETSFYDHTLDLSYYQKPPVELLEDHKVEVDVTEAELIENKNRIIETLENFGIRIDRIKATIGPTVTLYEIVPAPGVRISKIKNLEDDIALSLSALGIRIIAPIPGKGTIGIEVPNKDKEVVSMYSVVKSLKFQESDYDLPIVLGKTIQNETFVIDLAKMPHLLVAGATGQGKSVGLNAILASLLYKKHPSEIKFVLVDPKKVELTLYAKLEKHFLAKMPCEDEAIITDTQKVVYTLNSLCTEMDARYDLLKNAEVRNIKEYNRKFTKRRLNPEKGHRYLPYIVVIIDEFADMIMTAGREIETPIARLAQLARAVGIHLVIATQRPTTNIITGVIKANFPARIAFRVSSMVDSRTIIDQPGANQLIGRGDMLVSTGNDIVRVQCAFIDTPEVERITEFIGNQRGYVSAYELPEYVPEGEAGGKGEADLSVRDALFEEAARLIVAQQQGSTSLIQRKFSIGYNRAGRIMDQLEQAGIVGRSEGSKPREVKLSDMASLEYFLDSLNTFH